jgi:hypothetical protein
VHSLYRCKCTVSYRPYASSRLITFPERQIVSANVNLRWDPNSVATNLDSETTLSQFVNSLTGSTANVTLSDPYMTGIAWAALFDSAAAYTTSQNAAANKIMLPACAEGESPASGKCWNYQEIDDPNLNSTSFGSFAHLLIQYYYDVAGTRFGLTSYFRLQAFTIEHGASYPRVNLQGVDPQSVIFNQSLVNFQVEENKTLEENLKSIVEQYDYKVAFCTDPSQADTKEYIMPQAFKERKVTAGEIINKYVRSVKGNYLSLPTQEFAKKISLCTRSNINQGCSVFYLGKGLYESYQITGQVPQTLNNLNREFAEDPGLGYQYDRTGLQEIEYEINEIYPQKRKSKLKNAKTSLTSFPGQFEIYTKRYIDNLSTSGYVWESAGPKVTTVRKTKINLFGLNVNGTEPIALLDGRVSVAPEGLVRINTNYFIRFCEKGNKPPCQNRVIVQETRNLQLAGDIKPGADVRLNQPLGTSTAENPEHTRFFLAGASEITLSPAIVWKYAVPVKNLTEQERKDIGLSETQSTPSAPATTGSAGGTPIGRVGNTGNSTGPHLHAQFYPTTKPISSSDLEGVIEIGGKPPSQWDVSSVYGEQRPSGPHGGVDLVGNSVDINNQHITLLNGTVVTTGSDPRSGNFVIIDTPKGQFLLAHLADGSTAGVTGTKVSTGSRFGSGVRGGPAVRGAEITTEFKGVPRALRITPGRTILSFVTRYDEWIEKGKPADIDPGVWIAGRFSKYIVSEASYNWGQGDLRVSLKGITDWGVDVAKADSPSFDDYLAVAGLDKTKDYYGYIRSLGDLCWKLEGGKTSCEEICQETEKLRNFLKPGDQTNGPSVDSNFPASQCNYIGNYLKASTSTMNEVMAALKSVGITNPYAYAGVLGNFQIESGIRANRHKLRDPGRGCTKTQTPGYGIAQWCYSRQDNIRSFCGDSSTLDCELRFMIKEIREGRDVAPGIIAAMNNAKSAEEAASLWNQYYERGDGKVSERSIEAGKIYPGLNCERITS